MKTSRTVVMGLLAAALVTPVVSASAMQLVSEVPGRSSMWENLGATPKVITGRNVADVIGRSSTLPSTSELRSVVVNGSVIEFGRA